MNEADKLDELFETFEVTATLRIEASARRVWDLIADVERMVEFSPELVKVEWLDGATRAALGARFAGTSRVGSFEWTRNCTITAVEEPAVFAFEVADEADTAPQSRWRFEITPDESGTIVVQRFSHVPAGRSTIRLMAERDTAAAAATVTERAKQLTAGMRRTLDAMRAALER